MSISFNRGAQLATKRRGPDDIDSIRNMFGHVVKGTVNDNRHAAALPELTRELAKLSAEVATLAAEAAPETKRGADIIREVSGMANVVPFTLPREQEAEIEAKERPDFNPKVAEAAKPSPKG